MRFLSVLFLALAACPGTSKDSDSVATDDSSTTECNGTPAITTGCPPDWPRWVRVMSSNRAAFSASCQNTS